MIFENLPTAPRSEELLDKAFSRAARAGNAKAGLEAQQSMLTVAVNITSDNLENVVTAWPDFDYVDPFYYELADAIVDVNELRQSLSEVTWASRQIEELGREYNSKLRKTDPDAARKHRKQAFARIADIMDEIKTDLRAVGDARDELKSIPDIRPDEPAIVIAGYPNVGKSSFVNHVTRASNEIAEYPFTTRGVQIGHLERDHIRYQLIDTPLACLTAPRTSATISNGRPPVRSNTSRIRSCFSSMPPATVATRLMCSWLSETTLPIALPTAISPC
jgi:Predicted GTPase